ncbi:hypothetical protein N657DRAFT_657630 [Parathielavia appendiculata]|uniref:Uncharacterized protein n=1 Tax=Parathielavia appendiculata TaxID=2587402 RepID=A0AAN6TXC0_9PEZI|nr:hypothetical protein N657DRAFT_657630 [Parathielavia appendiculata]
MVKIAVAGPGHVASEIIDGLFATGRHEIVILSRQASHRDRSIPRQIRKYLADKSKDGKFLNYIAGSRQTAKHLRSTNLLYVDHGNGTAVVAGNMTEKYSLTAIADLVNIVVKAVEDEGEWPKIGGINGNTLFFADETAIGEEIKEMDREDLKAGVIKTSWPPGLDHFSLSEAEKEPISRPILCGMLLNMTS